MTKDVRTELLLQLKRKSNYIVFLMLIVLIVLCINLINKEYMYLVKTDKLEQYFDSKMSPIVNGLMLWFILFSSTLFIYYGFFMARYGEKENCTWLRKVTFDLKKIIHAQYLFFSILLLSAVVLMLVISNIVSLNIEGIDMLRKTWSVMGMRLIGKKILCIFIMAYISFTAGRIISYITKKTIFGMLICLVVDQFVIVKSWLTTALEYRVFSDVKYYIVTGEYSFTDFNEFLIFTGAILILFFSYVIMIKIADMRYSHEE